MSSTERVRQQNSGNGFLFDAALMRELSFEDFKRSNRWTLT